MIDFEYVNDLPPTHYSPVWPKVGIMAHLVMSDLLICSFSSREPTNT